jgi:hypothetical protein
MGLPTMDVEKELEKAHRSKTDWKEVTALRELVYKLWRIIQKLEANDKGVKNDSKNNREVA